jgi:hypothetical protein
VPPDDRKSGEQYESSVLGIGFIVCVLGIVSLFVPIPRNQRQGIKAGGVSVGVETQSQEKISPISSAAMILGGVGMMISGRPGA